jgi:hypothetical protein
MGTRASNVLSQLVSRNLRDLTGIAAAAALETNQSPLGEKISLKNIGVKSELSSGCLATNLKLPTSCKCWVKDG